MSPQFLTFLHDTMRFIKDFAEVIESSIPHIYLSALPYLPLTSEIARALKHHFTTLPELEVQGSVRRFGHDRKFQGATNRRTSTATSPDGVHAALALSDEEKDAKTSAVAIPPLHGHTGWVSSVAFSPDGTQIVSGSEDSTIRVWDAKTGQLALSPLHGHTSWVSSVTFSPDGTHIVSGSDDETIRVWDAKTGQLTFPPLRGHAGGVSSVAFAQDGIEIVSGSFNRTIRVWDAKTGQLALPPLHGHTDWVRSVAFSPDGIQIVSGSDDETLRVWDAKASQLLPSVHPAPISEHDTQLARILDLNKVVLELPHTDRFFSWDGFWVTGPQGELMMWIPEDYRPYALTAPSWCTDVIATSRVFVSFKNSVHGEDWVKCYKSLH